MKVPKIRLEPRSIYLLGGTTALLALLLLVRFLYLPVIGRIGEQRAVLTDLRVKAGDANVLIDQRPHHEAALHALRRRYRTLVESRLGSGQSVARVLETLRQQAEAHRLDLVATQPPADTGEQRIVALGSEVILREVPLTLRLTGRYRQIGEFLGALRGAPVISSMRELTLTTPQAESPKLQADLTLMVYLPERTAAR